MFPRPLKWPASATRAQRGSCKHNTVHPIGQQVPHIERCDTVRPSRLDAQPRLIVARGDMVTRNVGITGGDKLDKVLADFAKKLGSGKIELKVGFFDTETYPNGTHVAQVAFWNEYGKTGTPPRPFFRRMIRKNVANWGGQMAKIMKATDYDAEQSLNFMGDLMQGQLRQSIAELTEPKLSPVTVMLRGMRSQGVKITGATVGQAAARVAQGKTNYGASDKPLVDTGQMYRAVNYQVETE